MDRKVRILVVEHDPADIELTLRELKRAHFGVETRLTDNEVSFKSLLVDFKPHIILSDFSLPQFSGVAALEIRQEIAPGVPFLLVSGTIGEENAVELIKNGLTDYVIKDKLYTLNPKISRALNESEEIRKKHTYEEALLQSEANLRTIFDNTDVGFLLLSTRYTIMAFNPVSSLWASLSFGVKLREGSNFKELLAADKYPTFDSFARRVLGGQSVSYETSYAKKDSSLVWYNVSAKPVTADNQTIGICIGVHDITARKQAEQEVRKLNAGLEKRVRERTSELLEANTALEAFSYSVSHDLRSPVRSVIGFTGIINKRYSQDLNDEMKELLGLIESHSKRMNTIIDDLLTLARFGKERMHIDKVDMGGLFNKVWENHLFSNPHKANLQLNQLPEIYADGSMLEQVVVNLLSNAVKYSSKKQEPVVEVGCVTAPDEVTVYVRDNGAGFDMKDYEKLFGAFQRLHPSTDFDGTGVGLTLVRRIIEKHGGKVWAEAEVNKGATFYFSLPVTKPMEG